MDPDSERVVLDYVEQLHFSEHKEKFLACWYRHVCDNCLVALHGLHFAVQVPLLLVCQDCYEQNYDNKHNWRPSNDEVHSGRVCER